MWVTSMVITRLLSTLPLQGTASRHGTTSECEVRFYNDHVKTFLQHKSREKHAPPAVTDLRHVNLSLNPDGVESECESSSS